LRATYTAVLGGLICAAIASGTVRAQGSSVRPHEPSTRTHAEPGDRLVLHIVGEPLMSETVTVNDRGQVPLPKIGIFEISPFTIQALEDTLRGRYGEFLRTPAIEVTVLRRLTVAGEVIRPNMYYVDVSTSLREALSVAGGMTENAKRDNVYLMRNGAHVDLPNWQNNDTRVAELQSGDQLMVGRKSWFSINALAATTTLVVVASLLLSLRR
jgi:polysaccharide export outer membrane protein